ncbi:hypothetical protein DL93DRAFT_2096074 [Clavulina sp. PMI_390]|nr:hypothetical protein DL93DRAFT_2096074 [Clavulina sp. PMI_390]
MTSKRTRSQTKYWTEEQPVSSVGNKKLLSSDPSTLHQKCDGLKPQCSRCRRLRKVCSYSTTVQLRPLAEAIETRVIESELITHKLTMSSAHSLILLSNKLKEWIKRLGSPPQPGRLSTPTDSEVDHVERLGEAIMDENISMRDLRIIQRSTEQELRSYDLAGIDSLPVSLSNRLHR